MTGRGSEMSDLHPVLRDFSGRSKGGKHGFLELVIRKHKPVLRNSLPSYGIGTGSSDLSELLGNLDAKRVRGVGAVSGE